NYHTSTKTTPYEAVYCQTPLIHVPYIHGDSRVEEVDKTLQAREEAIKVLKFHLKRSQDRMRNQANKHRTYRQFEVGDWVYLKLQPHRQAQPPRHKTSPKRDNGDIGFSNHKHVSAHVIIHLFLKKIINWVKFITFLIPEKSPFMQEMSNNFKMDDDQKRRSTKDDTVMTNENGDPEDLELGDVCRWVVVHLM
nr:retrotransposon-related protein [Tanacetum cinerariifolium]